MPSRPLNVSQFIENLNSLDDSASAGSSSGLRQQEEDLSIFSNTHFFDFDMGCSTDIAVTVDDLLMQQEKQLQSKFNNVANTAGSSSSTSNSTMSSPQNPALAAQIEQFSILPALFESNSTSQRSQQQQQPQPQQQQHQQLHHHHQHLQSTAPSLADLQQEHISSNSIRNKSISHSLPVSQPTPSASSLSSSSASPPSNPRKRDSPEAEDSNSSLTAEEDKRRRNTAASARFRIKKKMREQQMERTAKDLQEKVQTLQARIGQLEMENKWLKDLVVEKNQTRDMSELKEMKEKIFSSNIKGEL